MGDSELESLYQEEMNRLLWFHRSTDATRNLSVLCLAGMIFFTFGLPQISSHLVMILGSLVIFALQLFEARAHQFEEMAEERVREIERNHHAVALDPTVAPKPGWRERLAASLAGADPSLGFVESFAGRIPRNYLIIFLTLDICWFAKLYLFPEPAADCSTFVHRLDSGALPGWFFLLFAGAFWTIYTGLTIWYLVKNKGREPRY